MTIQHMTYRPAKTGSEQGTAIPSDRTVYLGIDLDVSPPPGEAAVPPMTAVYAPDPEQLEPQVNMLLWFHGYKGQLGATNLKGYSVKQYLAVPEFDLRTFVTT